MTRDYHSGGKYPWRHAFRRHLAKNPHLWTEPDPDLKQDPDDLKPDLKPDFDLKLDVDDLKLGLADLKTEPDANGDELKSVPDNNNVVSNDLCSVESDISVSARTMDSAVRENLDRVMRKRSWSSGTDSSYDSDESLHPVEREFEKFINEVQKKWLHFRPKTPPPSPPREKSPTEDYFPLASDTPISVELRLDPPSGVLDTFTTSEFTLGGLYDSINPEADISNNSLELSGDDLLTEN